VGCMLQVAGYRFLLGAPASRRPGLMETTVSKPMEYRSDRAADFQGAVDRATLTVRLRDCHQSGVFSSLLATGSGPETAVGFQGRRIFNERLLVLPMARGTEDPNLNKATS